MASHKELILPVFKSMVRLYVIDDHYLIIEGLYSSFDLESDQFKVGGGSLNIPEALQKISPEKVDIIILDLFIGQSDPRVNLELIRKNFPTIPVVILSQESSLNWQVEMFKHGIKAYVNKDEDKSIMIQRLLQVFQGETIMSNEVAEILMKGSGTKSFELSSADKEILSYLTQGFMPKEIAIKLSQSESSIEKKLKHIREIYSARSNYQLIVKILPNQHPLLNL